MNQLINKMNLKTPIVTSVFFAVVSCLFPISIQAQEDLGGNWRSDIPEYKFSITDLSRTSPNGIYPGVVDLTLEDPINNKFFISRPNLLLNAKECCQAGIPSKDKILSIFKENEDFDRIDSGINYDTNKGFNFEQATDIVQYSFSFNDVNREGRSIGRSTLFFFVPNQFTVESELISLDIEQDLITSLNGLERINNIGKFNPVVFYKKTTPEAENIIALFALGIIGIGAILKRQNRSSIKQ